ncbi:MAG TPA: hypothetical protein PKG48_11600 [Bacteroidales bacterium]|nr:hypothetical protein [Bacteroidales bacterium]HPS61572.1 hypothetical protein [Bacteroidales bacterium]
MQRFDSLEFGCFYHIYNRGINGDEIFRDQQHYERFLRCYEKYIDPIADTFAWCLLRNHFHFLVRIKDKNQIKLSSDGPPQQDILSSPYLSRQFGNFFNSYAQSFNFRMKRTGSLFQTPFRRKLIDTETYFTTLIFYIHNNPVKHGFCEQMGDYPWSSYSTIISFTPTRLKRDRVIGWFDGRDNFIAFHRGVKEKVDITPLLFNRYDDQP